MSRSENVLSLGKCQASRRTTKTKPRSRAPSLLSAPKKMLFTHHYVTKPIGLEKS